MPGRKIKILHVYNVMNKGGAETFVFNVYKNIDRTRFQFDFLCQSRKKGVFDDELKKMGANIYHFKNFNSKHPMRVINEAVEIIKKNGPYDVVYLPVQFYSAFYCIAAKKAGVRKIVVHSHSAGEDGKKNILRVFYKSISRFLINLLSTDRIACGKKAGEFLFGKKEKIKIINNGVDLNQFYPAGDGEAMAFRRKMGIEDDELVIGHVGRFVKLKNHVFFVDLAKELNAKGIKYKIVLVGDGDLRKDFEKKIKNNNVDDSFVVVGVAEDPSDYLRMFDVFVLPSLYEGFPTVVVESLACGVPCVLSDTIASEAAIIDDMVDFESLSSPVEQWVDAIMRISCKNGAIRKDTLQILKMRGYDMTDVARKMEEVYYNW